MNINDNILVSKHREILVTLTLLIVISVQHMANVMMFWLDGAPMFIFGFKVAKAYNGGAMWTAAIAGSIFYALLALHFVLSVALALRQSRTFGAAFRLLCYLCLSAGLVAFLTRLTQGVAGSALVNRETLLLGGVVFLTVRGVPLTRKTEEEAFLMMDSDSALCDESGEELPHGDAEERR